MQPASPHRESEKARSGILCISEVAKACISLILIRSIMQHK